MKRWQFWMMVIVSVGFFLSPLNPGPEFKTFWEAVLRGLFSWIPIGAAQFAWRHGFLQGALRGPELQWHHKLIEKAQAQDANRRIRLNRRIESLVDR